MEGKNNVAKQLREGVLLNV